MRNFTESTILFAARRQSYLACLRGALVALLLAGSASAIDLDLDEYLQRANAAKRRGDWESAAGQFARALNHADLPRDGADRSAVHLEYGRAMGVLCQYDEAETYLLRAQEIAEKAKSPLFQVLYELGAISVVQKKFTAAVHYFSLLEREPRDKIPAPVLADAYEKYAAALAATGKPDDADARRREAARIRDAAPKAASPGAVTPYGTQCPKS